MEGITICRDGKTYGPYTLTLVQEMMKSGQVAPSDQAWQPGLAEWMPLALLIRQALGIPLKPGEYYRYEDVPWYRQSGTNTIFVLLGIVSGVFLLFPVVVLLTGQVYYNKIGGDGTLRKWGIENKVAAVVLTLIWLAVAVALFEPLWGRWLGI